MSLKQQPELIDVIDEHEEIFETIRDEASDPRIADQFGRQPLRLLKLHRRRGDQL